MVEAVSGQELWRKRVRVAERGGVLMKKGQVVDFLKDQARSFNPSVKFLRVADVAVRRALRELPNPPWTPGTPGSPEQRADGPTVRLAVLPLSAKRRSWQPAAASLRAHLMASLQSGPFEVLEGQRVDEVLKQGGWQEDQPLPEPATLRLIADQLGADVLLRGTVTQWGRSYLLVESWVKAGLAVELLDAASGEVIWSAVKRNTRHAGILKGPTGLKAVAVAPVMGLKSSHLERVAVHLAREVAGELAAAPAVLTYVSEPQGPPGG
jgi:hypothetical protein